MSRVIECENTDACKTWQAPKLDSTGVSENNYDFKLNDPRNITHREQQDKIRQQSFEKSYVKGYMEGLSQGKKELGEQYENLQSIMAALVVPIPSVDDQVVSELVNLSMAVVKQMIRRELKTSPDEIVAVVREALNLLPVAASQVMLELHPEDAKLIRHALNHSDSDSGWKIIEDPLLTRGGCRVLTKTSRIDATVEKQIDSVIAKAMGCEREEDSL